MYNILTLNKIASCGTDIFDRKKYNVKSEIDNPVGILVRSGDMHSWKVGDKLRAVARAGAGVNNIPVEKFTEDGIVVFNTPGANANAVKELVIAGLLISSRNVSSAINWASTLKGKGAEVPALVEKGKSNFAGPEIFGKTLGVIGLGAIGVLVANAAAALGMNVIGSDPYLSVDAAHKLLPKVKTTTSNKEIFETADYISLHIPYMPSTKGFIGKEELALMKNSVRLLNFARGELVDNNALLDALNRKAIGVYVTDFPSDELINVENVIAIPHLGASSPESEDNCAVMAVNELIDYIENGNITNSVNLPNVSMPITGDAKICVIHKNEPGVLKHITSILGEYSINIENNENKSKKDYAYSVFDVKGYKPDLHKELLLKFYENKNILRVRVIRN